MDMDQRHSALLRRGSLLRLHAVAGSAITCQRGMLWLTQEHDPVDRILASGESFVFDRPGVALLNALAHDAVIHYPGTVGCSITRAPATQPASALSLAADIGRIGPRYDPAVLTRFPAGARRMAVEREARRMRAQAQWLVLEHATRAGARAFSELRRRLGALLTQALRTGFRKQNRVSANG